eukprot:TRINITY_DN3297_c0_g1_i1.p1 TRINITY_DN3297_c0_g1~~TRINITY_DN3297_c0_g1_i1.p1  ORF type:complete len:693 (-),score=82.73 TRINITY_DN3297_c0_g1_i1:359-2437(-)
MPLDPELKAQLQRRRQAIERNAVAPSMQDSSTAQGASPIPTPVHRISSSSTGRRIPELRRKVGEFCHVTDRVEETPALTELTVKLQRQKQLAEGNGSSASVLIGSESLSACSTSSPTRKTPPVSPGMCNHTVRRAVNEHSSAVDCIEQSPAHGKCCPEATSTPACEELSGDQSTTPGSSCWSSASHDEASEKGIGAPVIDCVLPPRSWQGACSQQPTATGMTEEQDEDACIAEDERLENEVEQRAAICQSAQTTEQELHQPQSLYEANAIQERIANLKIARMRQRCVNEHLQAAHQQQNASRGVSPIASQTQRHKNASSLAATARRVGRLCEIQALIPSRSPPITSRLPSTARQLSPVDENHTMPFEPMPGRAGSRRATPSPRPPGKLERGTSPASGPGKPERGSSRASSPRANSSTERGVSHTSGPRANSPTQQGMSRTSSPRANSPTERGMSRSSGPRANSPTQKGMSRTSSPRANSPTERGMSRSSGPRANSPTQKGMSRTSSPRANSPTEREMSRASGPRANSPTQQGMSRTNNPRANSPTKRGTSSAIDSRTNSPTRTRKASSAAGVIRAFSPNLGCEGAGNQMEWLSRDFLRRSKHWKEQLEECKEKADYYEALHLEAERKRQAVRNRLLMHPESPQSQTRALRPMSPGFQLQDRYEASKKSSGNPTNHSPRNCRTADLALSERKR